MKNYRVKIINPQGTPIGIRGFVIPYYENPTFMGGASGATYTELANSYWATYRQLLSSAVFCFRPPNYIVTDAYLQVFLPFGFTEGVKVDTDIIGTKYVFNNKSYIEVINVVRNNYNVDVYLNYCLENGQICYQNVHFLLEGNARVYDMYTFPFYSGRSDWALIMTYIGNNYNMDRCSIGITSHNPVSVELGRAWFEGLTPADPDDPYPDDDSGGGDEPEPDGIPDDDEIPIPDLPDVDITDTGFITLYRPSLAQVKNLADYMWSDLFSLATFKKLFADPMDCILGFNVLPVVVPAGGLSEVTVGNISTGVSMTECASQWVEVDCGTVNIGTPYDTYLDYSPYTKYSIYLPYIGLQSLSADDVVGKPIHLVYHIDALSCSCVAYLLCGTSVLYQFAGSCGYSIPLTGDSFRNMVSSMINIATTVAGAVATGGLSAPLAVSTGASVAQNVMNAKPEVRRSGSVGSSAGIMGVQTPYLILEIPRICKPKDQHRYLGYPSFITDTVGNVLGYSEWESVILSGVPCTDEERSAIEEILKGGVYNV